MSRSNSTLTTGSSRHPYEVERTYSPVEARAYCARLARSHYENFVVGTLFCPRDLRQHFYNLYAYCRISDDLSDEVKDPDESLRLLAWWESELDAMVAGAPRHPVFVALSETVTRFSIPDRPFRDLLSAFRQDQTTFRYPTFDSLVDYCSRSANPVGRLVLYLFGYADADRQALSDKTCTALQLTNFWQDVSRDLDIGRVYLPEEEMERFGYTEAALNARRFTPEFATLMRFQVERTRVMFANGTALFPLVDKRVRLDVEMFSAGGIEILDRIEAQGFDVLTRRPSAPKSRQLALLLRRMFRGPG